MFGYDLRIDQEVDLSGLYIGLVVDTSDPKALERIKVRVIGVHDMDNEDKENSVWADHIAPSKGKSGEVPTVGDFVYVMFLQRNPMCPCWLGWVRVKQG